MLNFQHFVTDLSSHQKTDKIRHYQLKSITHDEMSKH